MVRFDSSKMKRLKFGVSVTGVDTRDLVGMLRFDVGGVEYGFGAKAIDEKLEVEVPALDNIILNLKEGQKINAKLEVIAGDTFLVPWSDSIEITKPITVEAKIAEEEEIQEKEIKPIVAVARVDEEDEEDKKPVKQVIKEKRVVKKPTSKFAKLLTGE